MGTSRRFICAFESFFLSLDPPCILVLVIVGFKQM